MSTHNRIIDDHVEQWMKGLCKRWEIPGLSLSLVQSSKDERAEETFVYGIRDSLEQPMETSSWTRLCIASNSKHFTAIAIGLLIHDKTPLPSGGLLNWNTKLKEIFQDDWQMMDNYMETHVDVLDLLSMRTGMPSHDAADPRNPPPLHYLRMLPHLAPATELRRAWQYNNMNFFIAAYLVQRVSGMEFTQFIQDKIFGPLDMTQSSYNAEDVRQTGERAEGFSRVGIDQETAKAAWRNANGPSNKAAEESADLKMTAVECRTPPECVGTVKACVPYVKGANLHDAGAGGIWTSVTDLCKWLGELVDPKIIPESILKVLRTAHAIQGNDDSPEDLLAAYGCGVEVTTFRSRPAYMHFGGVPGYCSITTVVPDSEGSLGIGIISNEDTYGSEVVSIIAYELMDRWLGTPQSGNWERKIFDGEFRDDDDAEDYEDNDGEDDRLPPVQGLEGLYRNPGYPTFNLKRLTPDDPTWPDLDKIRSRAESNGEVDWKHAYTGSYSAEYISNILFVVRSGSYFTWVTWDWAEEMQGGKPTGFKWPILYGDGKAVFSEGKNGIEGVGMFGDWWEQGGGLPERPSMPDDIKHSAEVWFEKQARLG